MHLRNRTRAFFRSSTLCSAARIRQFARGTICLTSLIVAALTSSLSATDVSTAGLSISAGTEQLGRPPLSFFELNVELNQDATDQIQAHLDFMVDYLTVTPIENPTPERIEARRQNIERLAHYASQRVFPQNPCPGLTPIFIDRHETACAVGQLMIESGAAELAQEISITQNLAYLGEITVPGISEWIERSGLTAVECAMIQPAYSGSFVESFEATSVGDSIQLTWDFGDQVVDFVYILRTDGAGAEFPINLDGEAREYLDENVEPGDYTYSLYAEEFFTVFDTAELLHAHYTWSFLRGDANGDGSVDGVADTIYILSYAFSGGPPPPCMEAADIDGNGNLEPLSDALYVMYYALASGPAPAFPFPACAPDTETSSSLGCNLPTLCP